MCMYEHTQIHAYMDIHIDTLMHIHTHRHMHALTHTHTQRHAHERPLLFPLRLCHAALECTVASLWWPRRKEAKESKLAMGQCGP